MNLLNNIATFLFCYFLFGMPFYSHAQWKYENSNKISDAVIITYDVIYDRELTEKEKTSKYFLNELTLTFNKDKLIKRKFYNNPSSTYHYNLFDYTTEKYYNCHDYKGEKKATEHSFKTPYVKVTLQPNSSKKIVGFTCEKSVALIKGKHKEIYHTKEIGLRFVDRFDIEGFVLEYPSYSTSLGHYKVVAREIKNYVLPPSYFSLEGFEVVTKEEVDQKRKDEKEKKENENLKRIGQDFPEFSFRSISGKTFNNKDFKRKTTVINFWFSTCSPCKKEIPQLNVLKKKYDKEKINFYAFSLDDEVKINAFVKENPFHYELIANAREFARSMGIRYYPTNIIVDDKGKIQFFKTGYKTDMVKQLSDKIDELIDK